MPDPQQRILEQIETARMGLLAAQSARPPASSRHGPPFSPQWLGISLFGTLLLGAWLWSRRRMQQKAGKSSPGAIRATRPAAHSSAGPATPAEAPVLPPRAGPEVAALECRMRMLEDSLLQVVRAVEAAAARPSYSSAASAPPSEPAIPARATEATGPSTREPELSSIRPDPNDRGPGADRDLSLPAPTTNDGRELPRIRRAVLRLAAEGWTEEKIAHKLRLGSGDVNLILKTGEPRLKAGRTELAGSRR